MTKRLVLHNTIGDVVRVLPWNNPAKVWAIFRGDTRRMEVRSSIDDLMNNDVPFQVIKEMSGNDFSKSQVSLGHLGYLSLESAEGITPKIGEQTLFDESFYRKSMLVALLLYVLTSLVITQPWVTSVEEVALRFFANQS